MNDKFKPAWWLPGSHLQTLWPVLLRRKVNLPIINERFELADGDFLDLAWVGKGSGPLVLVLHGLNGSVNSHYANGILHAVVQKGWRGVLMHFRGCSGIPNRLARSYHSGETGDLYTVLAELNKREPMTPKFAIGYSLGGNVLLKALGENKNANTLNAAVAISVPFDLSATVDHLCTGFSRLYQWKLVRDLSHAYRVKFGKVKKLKTIRDFDDAVTAPLHGFANAQDYYTKSSCNQFLCNIRTPTLIVHARNDPFTALHSLPEQHAVSNNVLLKYTDDGGHVGFIAGTYPWKPIYWLDQTIMNYFDDFAGGKID
jgi:predicted alpha/beta-fold hydrolase